MRGRFNILQQVLQLDPKEDCQEIVYLTGSYEYPWLVKKSLEFALFRTYGVPATSRILDQTGQFKHHGQRRYDDTTLILAEITEHGYESERGRKAIKQMNRMHGRFNIKNEEMLYVLSTFIYEPIRWNQKYGWRQPTHHENLALYYFWVEVGKRMGIKDIPDTIESFEQYNIDYERQHYAYDPANRNIADATLDIFQSWFPSFLHPIVRQGIFAMTDEPLRQAFGYPKAHPLMQWLAPNGLKLIGKIIRYLPPRSEPYSLTSERNQSHPHGYEIENLGPPDWQNEQ